MKFADFFCFEATIAELQSKNRDGVITELVSALEKAGRLKKGTKEEIIETVIKRENEASTGIGKGIALPHVNHSSVKNVVAAIGKSNSGIDFSSLDKQPVYSVILMISPVDNPDKHLQAMENVFKVLQQEKFRKFLRQSRNAEDIEDLLREVDENSALL